MTIHSAFAICAAILLAFQGVALARTARLDAITISAAALRPSQLALLYVNISYLLGALAFANGAVLQPEYQFVASRWGIAPLLVWAASSSLAVTVTNGRMGITTNWHTNLAVGRGAALIISLLLLLSAVGYILSEFYFLLILCTISATYLFCGRGSPPKIAVLSVVLVIVALFPIASESKRLIIFPIVCMAALKFSRKEISKITLALVGAASFALIVAYSVTRGYGGLEVRDLNSLYAATINYARADYFLAGLGNNLEYTYFYFHGVNSIQTFIDDGILVYGETFVKGLFLGLSRIGLEHELRSSIEIYTHAYDFRFRGAGGSYPANYLSEIYLNTGLLSPLFMVAILTALDYFSRFLAQADKRLLGCCASISFVQICLIYFRGSSFDIFFLHLIFAVISITVIAALTKLASGRAPYISPLS